MASILANAGLFDWALVRKQQYDTLVANAAKRNADAVASYRGQCETWVAVNLVNRGRGLAISPKPIQPKKLVVTDTGSEFVDTYESFTDLIEPELPAENTDQRSTAIASSNAPPADTKLALYALGVLKQDVDEIKAILKKWDARLGAQG